MEKERIEPSAQELILCKDPSIVCETYLFEPSPSERKLGYLFAAAETQDRDGIGKPLLDSIITAIQKEYYREAGRSSSTSFEMALHQANLLLYDTAEEGVRDWMGHFHVSVGVLADRELHVSVAGAGAVFLARKTRVSHISQGISHFPITDPLKTFSQVASGEVSPRDTLFFTSSPFESVFRSVDVGRFALEHSASTIASRLEQLYSDQGHRIPLAVTVVTLLPQYVAQPKQEHPSPARRAPATAASPKLQSRPALIIKRSGIQKLFLVTVSILVASWKLVWSKKNIPTFSLPKFRIPRPSLRGVARWGQSLPKTSKLFAGIAIVLLIALAGSLVLLKQKRASDQAIEKASQSLHQAQTKIDAAKTALIYDNREQAANLLKDAKAITDTLAAGTLYVQETKALQQTITQEQDRLQKIFRTNAANTKTLATIGALTGNKIPKRIFFVNGALYAANPETNTIISVGQDGKSQIVQEKTSGIGFITSGSVQSSDKTILYSTDANGLALFDTVEHSLTPQTITFPSSKPTITDLAVFGNRLYVLDAPSGTISSFNKTLRGFVGGTSWITDSTIPVKDLVSIAIDGNIFGLSNTGGIIRMFRGATADFVQATVDPSLKGANRIYTSDTMQNLYVLDRTNKRVVIFTKKGTLVRQLFFEEASSLVDIAVTPDEQALFALDGTTILEVSLAGEASTSPKP